MNKYRNKKTGSYASKKEAKRAQDLKLMEKSGEICNLREQVKYLLIPKQEGERECSYIADFIFTNKNGDFVCEDVKGMRTPVFVIKRKLMLWVHGIRITEI